MKIAIGNHEIALDSKEVEISRAAVDSFLSAFQQRTAAGGMSQYLTTIIYMYIKSSKLLDSLGLENAERLMKIFNEKKEN